MGESRCLEKKNAPPKAGAQLSTGGSLLHQCLVCQEENENIL